MYCLSAASSPSSACCTDFLGGSGRCSNDDGNGSQVPGAAGLLPRLACGAKSPPSLDGHPCSSGADVGTGVALGVVCVAGGLTRLATRPSIFCSTCEIRLRLV